MRTVLQLECTVLVPHDSTTVTVDWYWSKNISECGRYITEEQGRFDIHTSRQYAPQFNADRITKDLTIESPRSDTGYYWCQVNDPSYNGVFISSNKAPVFDTGTMTFCNGRQSISVTTCAIISNINTPSPFTCFISTQTVSPTIYNSILTSGYNETTISIGDIKSISSIVTTTVTTISGNTSRKSLVIATDHLFYSTSTSMYTTTSSTSIISMDNLTNDRKTTVETSSIQKSHTVPGQNSTSNNMYTTLITSSIPLKTGMHFKNSIITTTVSTPVYNDAAVPFTTNNTTLIISISLLILLLIMTILACSVIVVMVIIKKRKTHRTNNGK